MLIDADSSPLSGCYRLAMPPPAPFFGGAQLASVTVGVRHGVCRDVSARLAPVASAAPG